MPTLTLSQAQGIYTEALARVFNDRIKPTAFLRSFFPSETFPTFLVDVLASRSIEYIAYNVERGATGNRNTFSKMTQKLFETYYFREYFDATRLQLYEKFYSGIGINADLFARWVNSVVDNQMVLRETIERSIELMCSQILETGVVIPPGVGQSVDFQRKSGSIVDPGAGNYWANNVDVYAQLEAAGVWMRTKGKVSSGIFNLILGTTAHNDLKNNTIFKAQQNLYNLKIDDFTGPQRQAEGMVLHGVIKTNNYIFNAWTYPQYYQDRDKVSQPYINPKLAIVLPEGTAGVTAFGAVPQVVTSAGGGRMVIPKEGEFVFTDRVDEAARAHYYEVESAPLPILDAVDRVYTLQAVAP